MKKNLKKMSLLDIDNELRSNRDFVQAFLPVMGIALESDFDIQDMAGIQAIFLEAEIKMGRVVELTDEMLIRLHAERKGKPVKDV